MTRRDVMLVASTLALGMAAFTSVSPVRADVRTFGNWIVGCDNKAECTAVGTHDVPPDPDKPTVVLRIGVDRRSLSGFDLAIIPIPRGNSAAGAMTVICPECARDAAGSGEADTVQLHGQRIAIADMRGAHWLDALGKGRPIAVAWPGSAHSATVDASSFLEAWIYLAKTRGDLMRQASFERALPSLQAGQPRPERNRSLPGQEVVPPNPSGIAQLTRACPSGANPVHHRQFVLSGNSTLWSVQCHQGSARTIHWYQATHSDDPPAPIELPDADRGQLTVGERGFEESVFDFDFGILRARSGPAMREDCGIRRAWGWDGRTWVLLERRDMPACIGLSPNDWIRTYSAP